ncbi:MAG: OB-fold domain-containing protein [Candidatus Hadarchaeum sp.]|uniref:Zn-ribbon domain-containing OB-fold protein n=1 Tax=Candidatus Hadarchaeum sp. TaxID=2883567 RepID=UPI00316BE38D
MVEQKFVAYKCRSCGRVMNPKHDRCLTCKGMEFDEIELPKVGKLVTYTKLYALPQGIEALPPLTLGIVDFDGVRVLGQLTTDEPAIGMSLRPVWGKIRKLNDKDIYGFKFEPVS